MASFTAARGIIRRLLGRAVAKASQFLPVADGITIHAFPDFDDQTLALIATLNDRGLGDRVTVLVNSRESGALAKAGNWDLGPVRVVRYSSAAGMWALTRSSLRFTTHGSMGGFKPNRSALVINVWHGMPIKHVGVHAGGSGIPAGVTVATSGEFKSILAPAFNVHQDSIKITGLPRNDRLIRAIPKSDETREILGIPSSACAVMVMPTWRAPGEIVNSETRQCDELIMGLGSDAFDRLAESTGAVMVLKTHPLATSTVRTAVGRNVIQVSHEGLFGRGLSTYEVLAAADILVTDYSSVWVDYLLTDRPIIFAIADEDEYRASRGLYFADLASWLPGPVVQTEAELGMWIRRVRSGDDPYLVQRGRLRKRWHQYADAECASRLLELPELQSRGIR